ncbi:Cytochrome c [Rubripirellula amarantea]|uniref:Cytochrome c n=1 Tax=Rubripirellula amarantea TaxID=2527999 RepID=A0A5C5WUZ5_9BACT|nr:di-heme oxidoredictase family protein [Rubripirellula amarantea]TWT53921.1 Cytochrome c [Rubripirellula amarantea]
MSRLLMTLALVVVGNGFAQGVSPESIASGRQLFEKAWTSGNPRLGSDGLGPLFNGASCAACHNQGGVGGGGEAKFNANTIGIKNLQIYGGTVNDFVLKNLVSSFHPGFIQPNGTVINTFTISHHGGSPPFQSMREQMFNLIDIKRADTGGAFDASEARLARETPIHYTNTIGNHTIKLQARLFQRNTTALYGAGLLDQITDKQIYDLVNAQKSHPEISGRPATLTDGRLGRFGWRGNVARLVEFIDQASANEIGLETDRKPQPSDPMLPGYRNPASDLADANIEAISDFVAALPVPQRRQPETSKERMIVESGEQLFASVGCAVCHVPDVGPAKGVYSDILVHDMGRQSIDLNHAEPYIRRITPAQKTYVASTQTSTQGTRMVGGYYGPASQISVDDSVTEFALNPLRASQNKSRNLTVKAPGARFNFVAPDLPSQELVFVELASKDKILTEKEKHVDARSNLTITKDTTVRTVQYLRVHFEPTNFNQEWRTPPLWGVADSAPYMHDGRADTLLEAIAMHDGEAAGTRDRFLQLPLQQQRAILAFLETLEAPVDAPQPAM